MADAVQTPPIPTPATFKISCPDLIRASMPIGGKGRAWSGMDARIKSGHDDGTAAAASRTLGGLRHCRGRCSSDCSDSPLRSDAHPSDLPSLLRIPYAVIFLKKQPTRRKYHYPRNRD